VTPRWRELDSNSRSPVSGDNPRRPLSVSPGITFREISASASHQRLRPLRGRDAGTCEADETQPDVQSLRALPLYATHPVENMRERLRSNYSGTLGALALPTATHDSAVNFTPLVASGMIGNQRLEHSGEPRGKSFGSDTLGGNAGALA